MPTSTYDDDYYVENNSGLVPLIENTIKGIWPLVRTTVENMIDWAKKVVDSGKKWVVGWWPALGKELSASTEDASYMQLSGNGYELPDKSSIQISRYSPHSYTGSGLKTIYKSRRLTLQSENGSNLTTEGLMVAIGSCYQISANDQANNEIKTFLDSCNLTFKVSNKDIVASGLSLEEKDKVRIYEYLKGTNSWSAISRPLANLDTLSTKIHGAGTYMLGIEFVIDSIPPSIESLTPAPNSAVDTLTEVSAIVKDEGSGIDVLRTAIVIDSALYPALFDTVRSKVYVTSASLRALQKGKHRVLITVYDRFGNHSDVEYQFTLGGTEGTASIIGEPLTYSLAQNYPNPFNPSTSIRYTLPRESKVVLKVYDMLGRDVRTLVEQKQMAGEYEVEFEARELPSGVYFYRMQAGDFVETKKLMLLR